VPPPPAFGRSATDLPLQTGHSTRRTRDRRHPANRDPLRSLTSDGYRAIKGMPGDFVRCHMICFMSLGITPNDDLRSVPTAALPEVAHHIQNTGLAAWSPSLARWQRRSWLRPRSNGRRSLRDPELPDTGRSGVCWRSRLSRRLSWLQPCL